MLGSKSYNIYFASNQVEPPLTKTDPACISLSEFPGQHLLKWKSGVEDAKEGGEGDPVQVAEQSDIWLPSCNQTPAANLREGFKKESHSSSPLFLGGELAEMS